MRLLSIISALLSVAYCIEWIGQVGNSICNWAQLRASSLRDAIYVDGGELWWISQFSNGQNGTVQNDGNFEGSLFRLDLSQTFNSITTNLTSLFSRVPQNSSLDYIDGVMWATNTDELVLYGGLLRPSNSTLEPGSRSFYGYSINSTSILHQPGFYYAEVPDNMTRYVTNGAGVSAPSERLGFYFGGMRGYDWGPISNDDGSAAYSANTLISVVLEDTDTQHWTNQTLPENIPSRANAVVEWLPVSHSGILVVIGGVSIPSVIFTNGLTDAQKLQNNNTDSRFMQEVAIYDIASKTWYSQNTTGDIPSARALFCSVYASAADNSSHNIYIYGGYDGNDLEHTPFNDVYILSLPTFTWTRAYVGSDNDGRSGHQCIRVLPDQMLVVGGEFKDPTHCLPVLRNFNLNTLDFQNEYIPSEYASYEVPLPVIEVIGGNGNGSALHTSPVVWSNEALQSVFNTPYTKAIPSWYPYASKLPVSGTHSRTLKIVLATVFPVSVGAVIFGIYRYLRTSPFLHRTKAPVELDSAPDDIPRSELSAVPETPESNPSAETSTPSSERDEKKRTDSIAQTPLSCYFPKSL
ncbi:conserved hypothetical protein [Talaromyces stipitatus ATCC 10500]|uniref:Kelch repeat protein n=1 Tax=Talaromyces stipitatus (strain ATCC 10500 / CBS 375.48 / QM 6759 / NRRL 1006) TaxID=441959 RepID=B8MU77_TALSN|nr:uncharacterized protein TSTA_107720 [Talaromyces stipitatus ATCC 10500]EED11581.1 conserved hypothetical protein [Talaromyces stipitatus ATCC 10500]